MKKVLIALIIFLFIFDSRLVFAQDSGIGILPGATKDISCEELLSVYERNPDLAKANAAQRVGGLRGGMNDILGCAIKTGRVHLWMLPFFITALIRFLVSIAGLICVLFIVIGGYKYTMGGLTDDKESGKKTIRYAITGLIVVLLSWIIINVIQVQLTK